MASVQVGAWCYADSVAAANAACAAQIPATTISGANVVTLSCAGVTTSGDLQQATSIAPADGSASAVSYTVQTTPQFAPCDQADKMAALTTIAVALGVVLVMWWTYQRIAKALAWGRGDPA